MNKLIISVYIFMQMVFVYLEQLPPGMPSMAQARTIQGIPSGASDQEKVCKLIPSRGISHFYEVR